MIFVPRLSQKRGTLKLIRLSVCPSVPLSVCHKNFNLAHIFWSFNDTALIFGMNDQRDKPFLLVPYCDLTLTFDLSQGQICCRAGDHNSSNLLVDFVTLSLMFDLILKTLFLAAI